MNNPPLPAPAGHHPISSPPLPALAASRDGLRERWVLALGLLRLGVRVLRLLVLAGKPQLRRCGQRQSRVPVERGLHGYRLQHHLHVVGLLLQRRRMALLRDAGRRKLVKLRGDQRGTRLLRPWSAPVD